MSTSKPAVHDAPDVSQHDRELFHRLRTLDDMIRASEETEDKLRRISERRRIPPVPDLRFEYSYTRSVSQYVHVERVPPPSSEKGKEKEETIKKFRGIPESVKLFEVFWQQVVELMKVCTDG